MSRHDRTLHRLRHAGATLVEFCVLVMLVLFMLLLMIQFGLMYHAKSQLNYAAFEAARAGATGNASATAIRVAFDRAMTGYYGGGNDTGELAASFAKAVADSTVAARIEVLSPTTQSFDDFNSPKLAAQLGATRAIPNSNLAFISCPVDVPGCNANPAGNASGQTLLDANLLKLRITYGIPKAKQIPLAGPFLIGILSALNPSDVFRVGLVAAGRIPVVTQTVMRMQSPAIEGSNASSPGPGNAGTPVDPGPVPPGPVLPSCPVWNPSCAPACNPSTDPAGCRPPGCTSGDPTCDPQCGVSMCCHSF